MAARLVIEGAALTGTERVLDLYGGVGTFTLPLTRLAKEVVGVEANAVAAVKIKRPDKLKRTKSRFNMFIPPYMMIAFVGAKHSSDVRRMLRPYA